MLLLIELPVRHAIVLLRSLIATLMLKERIGLPFNQRLDMKIQSLISLLASIRHVNVIFWERIRGSSKNTQSGNITLLL